MARRWNLDYVADVHGNAMTYYYTQETNRYGRNEGATDVSYIRDSHLNRIEYGLRTDNVYGTAPNQVVFGVKNRCDPDCGALSESTKAQYPDVPFDLVCAGTTDCAAWAPSFFSTKRLASITTKQWSTTAKQHVPVDSYALQHKLPGTGDGTSPTLWLASIARTGHDLTGSGSTDPITLPSVSFASIKLPNRVDTLSGLPSFYRHRIESITTETGSVITASYELPQPCGSTKPTPAGNTRSCFPVRWTPDGFTEPTLDWFNKYAVTRVTATDPTGGAAATSTSYQYLGGAAWHYDDNEVVKAKQRTYGQFRGYAKVRTFAGDGVNDRRTQAETAYYRGMSKNNNSTVVTVTDSAGGVHEDHDELAGAVLEETQYKGENGPIDSSTITAYWVSPATATRNRIGLPPLTANRTASVLTYSRQAVTSGGSTTWRYIQTDNSYDANVDSPTFGVLKATYTHTVPANPAYDRCTVNTYAPVNTNKNLVGLIAQTETLSKACGGYTAGNPPTEPGSYNTLTPPASVSRPAQVVGATRTFYDDTNWSATFPQATAPTRGLATMTQAAKDHTTGGYQWQTTTRLKYDAYARPEEAYDGNGNKSTTAYTMNAAGLTTGITVTNALEHTGRTTISPMRGVALEITGPNGEKTTQQYDALGRTTAVWLNSRSTSQPANKKYSYVVSKTGLTSTTTQAINDLNGYVKSVLIYDAQLRPRQTQSVTPQSGRMVTDTFYDTRGWVRATYNGWWDDRNKPSTETIASATDLPTKVSNQTYTTYDGLGRPVIVEQAKDNITISRAITVHHGDRTTVIPPTGGTVTTAVTDPLDRTTSVQQYTTRPALGTPADTFTGTFSVTGGTTTTSKYGYDGHGNQHTITDAEGNTWTSEYDLLGQVTRKTDPDAGTTSMVYDGNGNVLQSTDARGKTTSAVYDALNRKTAAYTAATAAQSDANRTASWVYDNADNAIANMAFAEGKLTSSTAYWNGNAYKTQIKGYNVFGHATGETVTIPAAEGALAGAYEFKRQYSLTNGLLFKETLPDKGGLPAELVMRQYDAFDQLNIVGGLHGYTEGVLHDAYGRISQLRLGIASNFASLTNFYDEHTSRLTRQLLTRSPTTPSNVDQQDYTYDLAGNLLEHTSTRIAAGNATETRCYSYDELRRLTEAWTATDSCNTAPTPGNRSMVGNTIGGGSAYWTSWSFDAIGNRVQQVQRNLTGGTDVTTNYQYNGNGANQPHTLTGTTSTAPNPATRYTYDAAGHMTARNAGNGAQTLTWNDAGQLTKVSGPAGTTANIFDADGNLLLQKDPGTTTLYLPGQQHTLDTATGTVTGTRYYALPGGVTAIRTGAGTNYSFALPDRHGTPSLYLNNTAQTPTWRQYTPYGGPRGATAAYPDNRGFLNKPINSKTGLIRVGARDYDAAIGHFITVDPIQNLADPQQWHGYTYASNNPITFSDPTGLINSDCREFDCYGYNPSTGCHEGCGTPKNIQWGKKNGKTSTAARTGKRLYTGRTRDGRAFPMPGTGERWTASYYAQFFYLEHISTAQQHHMVYTDMCRDLAVGCEGLDNASPGVNWENVKELLGITDIEDCLNGSVAGCAWAAIGVVPVGRVAKLAKVGKHACSFTGETRVVMADGSTKPIADVLVGDEVLASDPETGETGAREVVEVFEHDDTVIGLDVDGEVVTTTEDHPFWNATDQRYERADQLDPGDQLLTPSGGTVPVRGLRLSTIRSAKAHNLAVDDLHTYYVLAGNTPVLVHNTGPCRPAIGFAPGEGVTALTDNRLQHGTKHLVRAGLLPNWSGKTSPELIRRKLSPILENPTRTVDHELGGTRVKGFLGNLDGKEIAVFVYKEGPYAGQLASSSIPTPNQLSKWGL